MDVFYVNKADLHVAGAFSAGTLPREDMVRVQIVRESKGSDRRRELERAVPLVAEAITNVNSNIVVVADMIQALGERLQSRLPVVKKSTPRKRTKRKS